MAEPTWVAASTGTTDATGAWTHTSAAPGAAGRVLIVQVVQDGVLASPTITSVTNAENLAGTDNVLTYIGEFDIGSPVTASQHLWIGRSLSTSAMVITGANSGGDDVYVRVYEFQNVNVGTAITDVIENGSAGATANGTGTSSSIADTGVTTLGVDRLALQFIGIDDDTAAGGSITGETGGDWIGGATVPPYVEAGGTDATLKIQYASMPTAGTINGGSISILGTLGWGNVGFALIGTTAGGNTYTKANWAAVDADGFGVSAYTAGPVVSPIFRRRSASRFLTHR